MQLIGNIARLKLIQQRLLVGKVCHLRSKLLHVTSCRRACMTSGSDAPHLIIITVLVLCVWFIHWTQVHVTYLYTSFSVTSCM